MTTERSTARAEGGFTLIEVLVAMLILAVGLLGLEALGIAAARSIHSADERSEFTMSATRAMEDRILEIRRGPAVVGTSARCAEEPGAGHFVCSQISTRNERVSLPAHTARVRVWVSRSREDTAAFNLVSHVYDAELP